MASKTCSESPADLAWLDELANFDTSDVPALFEQPAIDARDVQAGLKTDLKHTRRAERRTMLDMLRVPNAAKAVGRLPEPNESFHVVMAGNFNQWDLVPAVIEMVSAANKVGQLTVCPNISNTR